MVQTTKRLLPLSTNQKVQVCVCVCVSYWQQINELFTHCFSDSSSCSSKCLLPDHMVVPHPVRLPPSEPLYVCVCVLFVTPCSCSSWWKSSGRCSSSSSSSLCGSTTLRMSSTSVSWPIRGHLGRERGGEVAAL